MPGILVDFVPNSIIPASMHHVVVSAIHGVIAKSVLFVSAVISVIEGISCRPKRYAIAAANDRESRLSCGEGGASMKSPA